MPDLVRVRLENGYEATVSAALADAAELEVLADQDTVDLLGNPLPVTRRDGRAVKPHTTVADAADGPTKGSTTKAGKSRTSAEEATS